MAGNYSGEMTYNDDLFSIHFSLAQAQALLLQEKLRSTSLVVQCLTK